MSAPKGTPSFPYDHLAVLGFDRLKSLAWGENSEWFTVGASIAPEGIPAARRAIEAKRAGDVEGVIRYAKTALEADQYANEERAAGRTAKRSNIVGNAWSAWYEAITARAAPTR